MPLDVQQHILRSRHGHANFRSLVEPIYFAHRGGSNLHPENTLEGFRRAKANGAVVLDMDVTLLTDGGLGVMHDTTVDRTTTGSATVSALSTAQFKALTIDPSESWFGSSAWGILHPPTFEDVVREFRDSICISVEGKTANSVAKIVQVARQYNLRDSLFIQSGTLSELAPAVSAGIATGLVADAPDLTATAAAGVRAVVFSTSVASSYPADVRAAGLVPLVYTIQRQYDRDLWLANGVGGMFCDETSYVQRASKRSADLFSRGTWDDGMVSSAERGVFIAPNRWGFDQNTSSVFVLQGWACPIVATTYSIYVTITFDAIPADATRWASVNFAYVNDRLFNDGGTPLTGQNGYNVILRGNGNMQLFKATNSSASSIAGPTATGAISAGQSVDLRIDITPSAVSVTRTDVGPTVVSANDSAYRGGYFYLGKNGSGLHASFSNVRVV